MTAPNPDDRPETMLRRVDFDTSPEPFPAATGFDPVTNAEQFTPNPADVELVEVATRAHFIEFSKPNADGNSPCICGTWWDAADGPGWDEHLAEVSLAALAAAGRLLPADADTRPGGWAVRVTMHNGVVSIRHGDDGFVTRESAEQTAAYARRHRTVAGAEVVTRSEWVGPWVPVPTTPDSR